MPKAWTASAFLVGADGVIRSAWSYDTGDVPDVEEWLDAARRLKMPGASG